MKYWWFIIIGIILVFIILSVISFLFFPFFYFGSFSPKSYSPKECDFSSHSPAIDPFYCDKVEVSPNSVSIQLRNNLNESIEISRVRILKISNTSEGYCEENNSLLSIDSNETKIVSLSCKLKEGDRFSESIDISYKKSGDRLSWGTLGRINTQVK